MLYTTCVNIRLPYVYRWEAVLAGKTVINEHFLIVIMIIPKFVEDFSHQFHGWYRLYWGSQAESVKMGWSLVLFAIGFFTSFMSVLWLLAGVVMIEIVHYETR